MNAQSSYDFYRPAIMKVLNMRIRFVLRNGALLHNEIVCCSHSFDAPDSLRSEVAQFLPYSGFLRVDKTRMARSDVGCSAVTVEPAICELWWGIWYIM